MALEIEAKMKVDDHRQLLQTLKREGAQRISSVMETNVFFDTDDRRLVADDRGLRVRCNRDDDTGLEKYVMTHKGPRQYGQVKTREETELEVANFPAALTMLKALGFRAYLRFQKRRTAYRYHGCRIELDELPHLGTYVEIEGKDEETVLRVREELGLLDAPMVKSSYAALLSSWMQENDEPGEVVTFEMEHRAA